MLHHVICDKDPAEAEKQLLSLNGFRKYLHSLRTEKEKEYFKRHLRKYIRMYLPDSPFEVSTTNRYTIDTYEARVIARRSIGKGELIKYLSGTLVALTDEEEKDLDKTQKNFSMVKSSRKNRSSIFLGPARFSNHDCDANATLRITGSDGMEVFAAKNIEIGEEITVWYGEHYFGTENEECLCQTCEDGGRNGWSANSIGKIDDTRIDAVLDNSQDGPYSFRRKRKYEADTRTATPQSGAATPLKKPRIKWKISKPTLQPTPPPSDDSQLEESIEVALPRLKTNPSYKRKFPENGGLATPDSLDFQEIIHRSTEVESQESAGHTQRIPDQQPRKRRRLVDLMMSSPVSPTSAQASIPTPAASQDSDKENSPAPKAKMKGHDAEVINDINPGSDSQGHEQDVPLALATGQSSEPDANCLEIPNPSQSPRETLETHDSAVIGDDANTTNVDDDDSPPQAVVESIETPTNTSSGVAEVIVTAENKRLRTPGDYKLTPELLSQPYDRWVYCHTCSDPFVQSNGYQTRRECHRCERHSKLYGFGWPKTERQGKHDLEERVMDHRTVHRFLYPDEERVVKRKGSLMGSLSKRGLGSLARDETPASASTPIKRSVSRGSSEVSHGGRMMRKSTRNWKSTF